MHVFSFIYSLNLTAKRVRYNLNNTVKGILSHWHYDTYQIIFDKQYYGKAMLDFRMNSEAKVSYLEVFGERFDFANTED